MIFENPFGLDRIYRCDIRLEPNAFVSEYYNLSNGFLETNDKLTSLWEKLCKRKKLELIKIQKLDPAIGGDLNKYIQIKYLEEMAASAEGESETLRLLYQDICRITVIHKENIKNMPYIADAFKGKKIKLANGNPDFRAIMRIYKKEFGQEVKYTIMPLSLIILEILEREKKSISPIISTLETGLALEYKVSNIYRALGYSVDFTSLSGDFGIDVIVTSNKGKFGVQCKHHASNVGVDAVMQAHSGARYHDCLHGVVVTTTGFTVAAKEMAEKLGVELLVLA
ncbi:Predicted endonuclease distantly related to archaeal Holliday junction resolvase and Mrr-like restriction enzymes [Halomonas sp. R57-5]|uniref:restriction endonuclease n=1 Tax=Halomonas sp. R57-5 TaxID=1610576 RepID=UPI0005FC8E11|nr:restriction endonuclease [Halomonas sp. R57-5]CEP35101.1 Predicted endonuclease distantly related to archaeal Holliday junction resolvase and Mrr-like restriction enzymes [Halomonas sp. R57-5]